MGAITDMSSKKHIVVVGGSLAALMSSIPLTRLGHRVTILERSPTPLLHNQGAGVVAGGETQAFYHRHELSKRPIAVHSKQRLYLDEKGEIIDSEDSSQFMTSWDLLYYLGRANFDQVDSEYLENGKAPPKLDDQAEGTYEFGRMVTAVHDAGDKVKIEYEDTREDGKHQPGTMEADFLIAADGPSSRLRKMLVPDAAERKYVGYVAFRGTVPEDQISKDAEDAFVEKFTFFHGPGTQILAYAIPGQNGALEKGKRLVNWVWYCNYEEGSNEYYELMTDVDGKQHRFTVPTGGRMKQEVLDKAKTRAKEQLPPQFAELVVKTTSPFVQAITDLPPPEGALVGRLLNGKAVLVGDALSGFRPHTAASTGQAAFHALLLEQVFSGRMSWEGYEKEVLDFAKSWHKRGVMLGQRSQFGEHPLSGERAQMAPIEKVTREELWMKKWQEHATPE